MGWTDGNGTARRAWRGVELVQMSPSIRLGLDVEERKRMAVDTSGSNPNMDMQAHEYTYHSFVRFSQFFIAFAVILLVGMAIFLT
jgi:hypothetical protein